MRRYLSWMLTLLLLLTMIGLFASAQGLAEEVSDIPAAEYVGAITENSGNEASTPRAGEPVITVQADKTAAYVGEMLTYQANVQNTVGTVSYQWEKSDDGGATWTRTTLTGYNTPQFSFSVTAQRLTYQYRVAVTDASGTWYSSGVQVNFIQKAIVTAQAGTPAAVIGSRLVYQASVANTVGTLSYQWEKSDDGGVTWTRTTLSGYNTATFYFDVTAQRLSYQYRVAVTDDNRTWYSEGVQVNLVNVLPVITATADRESAYVGENVTYTANVQNTVGTVSYQWEKSDDGGATWTRTTLTGYNTPQFSFSVTAQRLTYQYRVAVTDASGTWYSSGVQVNFIQKAIVTAQAGTPAAVIGSRLVYQASVANTVGTLSYQWEKSDDGGVTWTKTVLTGYDTANFCFSATAQRLTYQYRVAVTDDSGTWYSAGVQVNFLQKPLTITVTANNPSATVDETVTLSAALANVSGTPACQWQYSLGNGNWSDLNGSTATVLSFTADTSSLSRSYRLQVTDNNGVWYSDSIQVRLITRPVITATADRSKAFAGDTVNYTVTTQNTEGTLTYPWEKSDDGGATWTKTVLSGYNTANFYFSANAQRLTYQYRAAVTDQNRTWYSEGVSVQFLLKPVITVTANRQSALLGDNVTLTASLANIDGTPTCRWQYSDDNVSWHDSTLDGNRTAELSFSATDLRLNRYYRLGVTDANGIWYSTPVYIFKQPVVTVTADRTVAYVGESVTFRATASDTVGTAAFRWQMSADGAAWTNVPLPGSNTSALTFEVTQERLSYYYRAAVTDAHGTWYGNSVKVEFREKPVITAHANRTAAYIGQNVNISVTTANTHGSLSYQWQRSMDGENWMGTDLNGYRTATLHFDATEARCGYFYRAAVTDADGTWYSNAVQVQFLLPPVVTATADTTAAAEGETVTFTATASNMMGEVSYQWQFSREGVIWFDVSFAESNTATMSFAATQERLGFRYRVVATDENGSHYSNSLKITLLPYPSGRRFFALLIGQTYLNTPGITTLESCYYDMVHMAEMMESMTATDYTIVRKTNLTSTQILSAVREAFAGADEDDVCVIYYSGHGFTNTGNLVGTDYLPAYLSDLRNILDTIPGDKVIILDSCYSGRMMDYTKGFGGDYAPVTDAELDITNRNIINTFASSDKNNYHGGNYYILTASSATESSWCNSLYGYFTYSLLHGCGYNAGTGRVIPSLYADNNGDGYIALKEAYSYAYVMTLTFELRQHTQVYPINSNFVLWGR